MLLQECFLIRISEYFDLLSILKRKSVINLHGGIGGGTGGG